ncbi:MAG TPA: helix-turn-helix domain-containing protein [Lentibacillus sp.]|uniref:helix-turn-helix domain-containing protein n=1 Tax=Lentibacillus sp. TaxID=1925746 RepID=UPI002B4B3433|nr:helix-turn-helix domain-containing protein [Lentibacillus sp.]HLR63187.1 helix-turn-helix domain-containing protein [Lentibacillus sp.]
MLFDYIIMSCCSRFKDGRSISAVYHLLKGKRSIQTVQDSHIYQLNRFYGIYPSLQKRDFEEHIHQLADEDMLLLNNTNAAMTTVRGENWLREQKKHVPVNYFNGMEYYQKASIFLERLLLLIQTMTNSKKNNFHFIPVVDKRIATNWVKRQYYQTHRFQANFLNQLYEELYQLLKCFSEMEANIFVDSLTGYNHYGMSSFQIADHYEMKQLDVPLVRTAIVHHMLTIISRNTAAYPLFTRFLQDLPQEMRITSSAGKTKELLDRHYSAEDIAIMRQLKLNTIYDHVVEIALYDENFPIEAYVTAGEQAEIKGAVKNISSFKLKAIKQEVNETISYFQIRLVLAVEKIS